MAPFEHEEWLVDEPGRLLAFLRRKLPSAASAPGAWGVNGTAVVRPETALAGGDEVSLRAAGELGAPLRAPAGIAKSLIHQPLCKGAQGLRGSQFWKSKWLPRG